MQYLILIIAIFLIFAFVFKKVNVVIAVSVGAVVYGFLTYGLDIFEVTLRSIDVNIAITIGTYTLAIFLTESMYLKGVTKNIVKGLNSLGAKSTAIMAPTIIGLLPMPGGAYASAMITDPVFEVLALKPEERTYINYWFRHVFAITWPLYPGVIIVANMIGIEPYMMWKYTWPISVASIIAGIVLSIHKLKQSIVLEKDIRGIIHLWPLLIVMLLTLLMNIPTIYALLLVSVMFVLTTRIGFKEFKQALKYALNPTIIGVVIAALIFSKYILFSNIGIEFLNILKGWETIASFLISFILGLTIGIESISMTLSTSILISFVDLEKLVYGFLGVYLGHLLSPSHPCLVITIEYFKSEYPKVYKYVFVSAVITLIIAILALCITSIT